jgi:HlyD family secretion protein
VAALTIPVEESALTVRITASGTVEPVQTVNISPKTSGILEALYVNQGDRVEAGQIIAKMESRDIEAQVRLREAAVAEAEAQLADVRRGANTEAIAQAEAAVQSAAAQIRDSEARLDLAEAQLERNRQLATQGAISANELDNFVQAVRSAEAALDTSQFRLREAEERVEELRNDPRPEDLAQAQARVEQARAQLESAQVQLADTVIRAPFAGIVTQKFANEGAFVTPTTSASDASSATSTAIVAIANNLEVLAEVPEADISKIRPGQTVEIVADAFPDQVFAGEVRLIAPEAIERQNVTLFQVRIELLSGQDILRSNMNVTVAFIGDALSDALVVPTVAVVTQNGQSGVLVPGERDRIRFRPVTLGSQAGDQIQILEGVEAGDLVFVDLPPGQTLENLTFGRDAETEAE